MYCQFYWRLLSKYFVLYIFVISASDIPLLFIPAPPPTIAPRLTQTQDVRSTQSPDSGDATPVITPEFYFPHRISPGVELFI